jgi:hypothetical protein
MRRTRSEYSTREAPFSLLRILINLAYISTPLLTRLSVKPAGEIADGPAGSLGQLWGIP